MRDTPTIADLLPASDSALSETGASLTRGLNRRAFRYWLGLKGKRAIPLRSDFHPSDIVRILPSVMLIEVLHAENDFLYRVVGTRWVDHFGRDDTRRRMSEIPHQKRPSTVWSACSRVVESGEPYVPEGLPYVGEHFRSRGIEVLIMPLSRDGTRVDYLFVTVDFVGDE